MSAGYAGLAVVKVRHRLWIIARLVASFEGVPVYESVGDEYVTVETAMAAFRELYPHKVSS